MKRTATVLIKKKKKKLKNSEHDADQQARANITFTRTHIIIMYCVQHNNTLVSGFWPHSFYGVRHHFFILFFYFLIYQADAFCDPHKKILLTTKYVFN